MRYLKIGQERNGCVSIHKWRLPYPWCDELKGVGKEFLKRVSPVWHLPREERGIVLYVRITSPGKENQRRLRQAVKAAQIRLKKLGYRILKTFSCVESYSVFDDRPILEAAVEYARLHSVTLVAPSRDRFLRHCDFRKTNESDPPMINEYRILLKMANGVVLATILHPNRNGRGNRTKEGQRDTNAVLGRPKGTRSPGWCDKRRKLAQQWAMAWRKEGCSYQKITEWCSKRKWAKKYRAPSIKTVWNWINWPFLKPSRVL